MGYFIFARIKLQHGDFREWVGRQEFRSEAAAIVEDNGQLVRIEHVTGNCQDMALAGNQQSTLVGNKSLGAAGPVELYNLRLHVASDIDQGRRAVAGPRNACPGEEAGEGKGDGADVFAS